MKNVLEIEDHQHVSKEGSDPKRCFYCIESIVGKQDYKTKKQKLPKCKWVCQKCSRSLCRDHLNSVCNRCFQAMQLENKKQTNNKQTIRSIIATKDWNERHGIT